MRHDDPATGQHRIDLLKSVRDEFVGQPMKAKAPQAPLVIGARQRVGVVDEGVAAMKRRVETHHLRHARKRPVGGLDAGEVMRLVQRRERRQRLEFGDQRRVDDGRLRVIRSAMHHAVADGADLDFGEARLDPCENIADRLLVVARLRGRLASLAAGDPRDKARAGAELVDFAAGGGRGPIAAHREHGEFDR